MSNILQELAKQYAIDVANFTDKQVLYFLKKNLIPMDDMRQTHKWLKDRGLRLLDEIEGDTFGDKKHTLVLARVIDQHEYTIKAPEVKL